MNEKIIEVLKARVPELQMVYLFGSQVTGRRRGDSDVDVAFLGRRTLSDVERFDISNEIACGLNSDVDLVDLSKASEVMKVQVIGGGKSIFAADPIFQAYFEMYALSDYARLNEERREILEKVRKPKYDGRR